MSTDKMEYFADAMIKETLFMHEFILIMLWFGALLWHLIDGYVTTPMYSIINNVISIFKVNSYVCT